MDSMTWEVTFSDGTKKRVDADAWQIGPNGDLAFLNGPHSSKPFFVRGYAAGVWNEVSLYA